MSIRRAAAYVFQRHLRRSRAQEQADRWNDHPDLNSACISVIYYRQCLEHGDQGEGKRFLAGSLSAG